MRSPAFRPDVRAEARTHMKWTAGCYRGNPHALLCCGFLCFCGPCQNLAPLRRAQACLTMHQRVIPRRHVSALNLFSDAVQPVGSSAAIERAPFRKIQMLPAFVYIASDKPGNRRHAGIPGPDCCIGMAVVAYPLQHRLDGRPGRNFRSHGRVRFIDPNKLRHNNHRHNNKHNGLQASASFLHILPCGKISTDGHWQ
jgi:hypothetical protein